MEAFADRVFAIAGSGLALSGLSLLHLIWPPETPRYVDTARQIGGSSEAVEDKFFAIKLGARNPDFLARENRAGKIDA